MNASMTEIFKLGVNEAVAENARLRRENEELRKRIQQQPEPICYVDLERQDDAEYDRECSHV